MPTPLESQELQRFQQRSPTRGPSPEDTLDGLWFRELLAFSHGDAPGLFADLLERFRQDCLALRPRLVALATRTAEATDAAADSACQAACRQLAQSARSLGLGRLATHLAAVVLPRPGEPDHDCSQETMQLIAELDRGLDELLDLADEDGEASNPWGC